MKPHILSRVAIGLAFAMCLCQLRGADWFVDASLNAAGPGSSWATAMTNIQAAIDIAAHGDTVRVAPGTYRGTINLKEGLHLIGAGSGNTLLVGGTPSCVVRAASGCRIEGFTIRGDGHDDVDGVFAVDVDALEVFRNVIDGHSWSGISAIRSSVHAAGNLVVGNRVAGLFLRGQSSQPSRVEFNTICANRNEAGVNVWGEAQATVAYNIITGNTGAGGINCSDGGRVNLQRNNVFGNSCLYGPQLDYVGCVAGETDFSVDPVFANPDAGDYRLRRGSPCIDAGRAGFPEGLVHDIAGDPRCADGNCDGVVLPDIGAFETQPLCLGISALGGLSSVRLSWNSLPGEIYTVLATDSLEDGAWLDAGRISSQGDETRWSESLTAGRLRLYRILTHE
jgi:hypothetical protein